MKYQKKFLLAFALTFVVLTGVGSVFAKDIAYIAKDSSNVDSVITSLLDQKNYTYDVIYQTGLDSADFSKYKIILVGDGSFANASKIPVNQKNSVILNNYHIDDWHWSDYDVSTKTSSNPANATVYDSGSSIVSGVASTFIPYSRDSSLSSYSMKYISSTGDAAGLNTIVADDLTYLSRTNTYIPKNGAVVATINKGGQLRGGYIANARGVYIGFSDTALWTDPAKQVFYNAIDWAINGEDRDKDGFFTDMDCNDNNASINPNATEIPYNHIDENCDGFDLADVDKDGYCKEGYAIVNASLQCPKDTGTIGTDCNDNDSSYNIGSTDLSKNCVNDAPVIETIPRFSVHETENVTVNISAYDPEGDAITYSINDSRFVQDPEQKNVFVWQTNYTDAGDYKFFAIVSDGTHESSQEFLVKVWNKNKPPELLQDIPAQEWEEDTNHTLNLSSYFYDLDGDTLYYMVANTSSDTNIDLIKIENGTAYFNSKKDWSGEDWIIFEVSDGINLVESNNITLRVLPVNDPPTLLQEIGTVITSEDEIYYLNLSDYIYDPDSELQYTFQSTPHVNISMDGNVMIMQPEANWNGEESSSITASDGEFNLTDDFTIKVIPVNDAPVLEPIEDKFLLAGEKVTITPSATDVENDTITYSVNDARFTSDNPENTSFSWQTGKEDFGVYNFDVRAFDGAAYGHANAKVSVMQKIFINELVWGNNGWVEVYNPESLPFILDNCTLSNGNKELTLEGTLPGKGFAAFDWGELGNTGEIELVCHDVLLDLVDYPEFDSSANSFGRITDGLENESGDSFKIFDYPTKGVSNTADVTKPEVTLNAPENNSLFTETRDVTFEFTPTDNLAEEMQCSIIANSQVLETNTFQNNTKGSFFIDYLQDGVYSWNVECSDGTNNNSALEDWMINISAPDAPVLNYIGNKVVNENNNLHFIVSATDKDNDKVQLTTSGLPDGATFSDTGNNNGVFDWTPNYNQSGTYNVKFTARDPTGLEDSQTITILVGNTKEPPKFSDADVCSSDNKNNLIEVSVRNPKEGDKFEINDTINGTVKIKNNLADSVDFNVNVYLYDLNEDQVVDEFSDSISVNDGQSENMDFSIKIPDNINSNSKDFAIYAYVEGDSNECNSNYSDIIIERKKHDVVISDVTEESSGSVSPGEDLQVKVKAENLGRSDEDIYINVGIPSLNISAKSDKITIEKYGGKDTKTATLDLTIPDSAKYGDYDLVASLTYNDGSDSNTTQLTVGGNSNSYAQMATSQQTNENTNPTTNPTTIVLGNSNSGKKGYSLTTTSTNPSTTTTSPGNTLVLKGSSPTSNPNRLVSRQNSQGSTSLEVGVNEKITKEPPSNLNVEIGNSDSATHPKVKLNQWVILAIVFGLLIIIILALMMVFRRNSR